MKNSKKTATAKTATAKTAKTANVETKKTAIDNEKMSIDEATAKFESGKMSIDEIMDFAIGGSEKAISELKKIGQNKSIQTCKPENIEKMVALFSKIDKPAKRSLMAKYNVSAVSELPLRTVFILPSNLKNGHCYQYLGDSTEMGKKHMLNVYNATDGTAKIMHVSNNYDSVIPLNDSDNLDKTNFEIPKHFKI